MLVDEVLDLSLMKVLAVEFVVVVQVLVLVESVV